MLPGRMYISYVFGTGCVWATESNPCSIQPSRLQGVEVDQEFRVWPHLRVALLYGFYNYCDQGNPVTSKRTVFGQSIVLSLKASCIDYRVGRGFPVHLVRFCWLCHLVKHTPDRRGYLELEFSVSDYS